MASITSCPFNVATVLTVYGIETLKDVVRVAPCSVGLQQCLPFTVLKRTIAMQSLFKSILLQQCLPFTVLKP